MERRTVSVKELEEYRNFLAASVDSGKIIVNRDGEQTAVVIAALFRLSKQRVDLLVGSLDPKIYGAPEVTTAAANFLSWSEARIRILAERPIVTPHPFFDAMEARGVAGKVEVLEVPHQMQAGYKYRLVIGDGQHFRLEPDRAAPTAYVKFGDPIGGQQLQSAFDALHQRVEKAASPLWHRQPA